MMTEQPSVPARLAASTGGASAPEDLSDGQLVEQFVRDRSETAFTALVRRYGSLVLGVCRRLLHNAQDAEDAFQATFLVLARKASTLRKPELLASWLYGVAYRTARHARARAARRSQRERAVAMSEARNDPQPLASQELRQLLDDELARLPEKYRAPLVLCYLEGKTNEEAARLLGWPPGSMSYRLARGREILRRRLSSRHRALPLLLPPFFFTDQLGAGVLPARLARNTVQAALALQKGNGVATGLISASVRELMQATLASLAAARRRWLVVLVLALVIVSALATTLSAAIHQVITRAAAEPAACHKR